MEKYRHELKYLVSGAQIPLLRSRIEPIMRLDPHVTHGDCYRIRSLYYDDYRNTCYYENENGTDPREKYRIRIYNNSAERISLECKRKERGKTLKTSCLLTADVANALIRCQNISMEERPALMRKMLLQMRTRCLRPVTIVEYDRIPYIYRDGNVRVTFDINLSSSERVGEFLCGEVPRRPIMSPGWELMEVKFDEFLPDFIYRTLNLGTLQQTAFSKYSLCRKYARVGV